MDQDQLQTFLLLAKYKNFTKVAEMQNVVQSTVSTRIQELEYQLGYPLFNRNCRQVELSAEGLLFLPYAKRIVDLFSESKSKLDTTKVYNESLTIGAIDTIWRYYLTDLTNSFLISNTNVAVHGINAPSEEIVQLLIDNIIDIAYIAKGIRLRKFQIIQCFQDDIIFVSSPRNPISKKKSISLQEIFNMPLIYSELSFPFIEWIQDNKPRDYSFQLNMDNISQLVPFLVNDIAPGFMVKSIIKTELMNNDLVEIPISGDNLPPKWEIYAAFDDKSSNFKTISKWLSIPFRTNNTTDKNL